MITFGYWDIRTLGQPIRNLLVYLGVKFTDKIYTPADSQTWHEKDKVELGIPLANLPYLIDGEVKLSESNVIPTYLIKKYKRLDLLGINSDGSFSEKEFRVQQILQAVIEFRGNVLANNYSPYYKFEDVKDEAYKGHQAFLKKLLNFLGEKEFLVGTLSYADFVFYEALLYFKYFYPEAELPQTYMTRFENIPELKEYLNSPDRIHKQFNP